MFEVSFYIQTTLTKRHLSSAQTLMTLGITLLVGTAFILMEHMKANNLEAILVSYNKQT